MHRAWQQWWSKIALLSAIAPGLASCGQDVPAEPAEPVNPPPATITYMGLDSIEVSVERSSTAAILEEGRWSPTLEAAEVGSEVGSEGGRPLTLISLGPSPTFGQFIRSIRDLKARGYCNILLRESADQSLTESRVRNGSRSTIAIMAFGLCGDPIGDAMVWDTLPDDRGHF